MESPKQIKELGRFVKKIHFLSFPIPVKPGMYIRLQGVPKMRVLSSFHPYMALFARICVLRGFPAAAYREYASPKTLVRP